MQTDSDHYIASRLDVELIDHEDGQITRQTTVVPRTFFTRGSERKEDWVRLRDGDLGEGGGGCVFLEQCVESGLTKRRAVKVVKCLKIDPKKEIEAAMLFSHTKYQESFVESFGWYKTGNDICIAMEYLPLGSLGSVPKPIPESETRVIVRQILEALRHMDAHSFVHRDIKPENILVKQTGPNWWIKIADFGISKRAKLDNAVSDTGWYSRGYEAPEQRGLSSEKCSHTTDIFTTGIVAYLLLAGHLPFPEHDPSSLVRYYKGRNSEPEGSLRSKVSPDGHQFIMLLLHPEPTHRPTAKQCLDHSWVKISRSVQVVPAAPQEAGTIENKTQPTSWWDTVTSLNFTGLFTAEEPKKQAADDASQEAKDDKLFEISRTLSMASTASQALSNGPTAPNRVHSLTTVGEEPLHQRICASPRYGHAWDISAQIENSPRHPLTPPEEKILVSPVNGQKRSFTDPYSAGVQQNSTPPRQTYPIRTQRQSGTWLTSANDAAVHAQAIPVSLSIGVPQFDDSGYHSSSPSHMHSRRSMDSHTYSQTPYRIPTPPVSPPSTRHSYEATSGLRMPITHPPRASVDFSTPDYHPHSARRVQSMASFSSECSATAWEGETVVGECNRRVTALNLAESGKYGASWSQDGLLKLWDPRGGQNRGEMEIRDVTSLIFSPNSTVLAIRTTRALKLFGIEEWPFRLIRTVWIGGNHPKGYVFASECVFSRDSQRIAVVLEGSGGVWLVNTENGDILRKIKTTSSSVTSIAASRSPHFGTFAGSLDDNTVRIWGWHDHSEDRVIRHCASSSVGVTRVAYNADGLVAATSKCGVLQIRYPSNATVESKSLGCELLDCAFCPGKDLVVTADSLGYVRFFRATGAMVDQNLWIKHRERGPVLRVLVSPDGTWGVSCGYSTLEVWHTATAKVVHRSSMPQSDDGEGVKACFGSTLNKANILAIASEVGVRLLDLGPLSCRVSTQHP